MHCKPCEVCTIREVCAQSAAHEPDCPIEGASENETVKHDYKEE